jgi:hypothetical protein
LNIYKYLATKEDLLNKVGLLSKSEREMIGQSSIVSEGRVLSNCKRFDQGKIDFLLKLVERVSFEIDGHSQSRQVGSVGV